MNVTHYIFRIEKYLYFLIWVLAVSYSLYCFADRSYSHFLHYEDYYDDFTDGYYFSSRRDKSDFEWEAIYYLIVEFFPWIFMYSIISEFIRALPSNTKVFQLWQICFTISYILFKIRCIVIFVILFQPVLFYLVCNFYKNTIIIWLCNGISLLFISNCKQREELVKFLNLNYYESYFLILCLFWMNLKCTSYFLERYSTGTILDFLAYCLYPPTLLTGPFISYKDYSNIYKPVVLPLGKRMQKLALNLGRCLVWFSFNNFCLHYIYVNATSYQLELVESLDNWSLYGYGYAMGQFFHIKYIILYGLSTSFASFENVNVPHLPRCIGRIHLYSDMWKYFDPGLYNFLLRSIYIPLCKMCHYKLLASFTCFIFVYLWHGVEQYILIWTILNYVGIVLEYLGSLLYKKYIGQVDSHWSRRIKCVVASPLLVLSAVSNFYFFAGTGIGNIFMDRILKDNLISNVILLLVLYCCCQVSTELQHINAHKM